MKPLKLRPAFKDYLWGGNKLNTLYGKRSDLERTAESWEISVHPDGLSQLDGGGTLAEYIAADPSVLGTARTSDELPILVKLIDAADDLSVQVHPNDEQARLWEGQNGKTELWYIVQAESDARIIFGVKEDITPAAFSKAIRTDTVEALLETYPTKVGDAFFVEAGTVHAIGKGNLIAEIQQNSNVTYRLYDYDRRDKNGQPRELHIEKGVRAAVLKRKQPPQPISTEDGRLLGRCNYFEVLEKQLCGTQRLPQSAASYQCLLVVNGELTVDDVPLNAGEAAFLPACDTQRILKGNGTVLLVQSPRM